MIQLQNDIFFGELLVEVLLNTIAFGFGGFYNDIWKLFDLFVCLGTAIGYVSGSARMGQFAKTFRILRVVRLMKMIKPIRVIMETLVICLPQLFNIIILLYLVYSMFAVVAVEMFGVTKNGWRIGPTANFYDYPAAMYTIFQIITGDEWQDMMGDLLVVAPACTEKFTPEFVYGWEDSVG
jgi:voltage-gated sodium channel